MLIVTGSFAPRFFVRIERALSTTWTAFVYSSCRRWGTGLRISSLHVFQALHASRPLETPMVHRCIRYLSRREKRTELSSARARARYYRPDQVSKGERPDVRNICDPSYICSAATKSWGRHGILEFQRTSNGLPGRI